MTYDQRRSSATPQRSGAGARIGDYPGKLVCLRCDLKPGPGAMTQCEKAGHHHALAMDSDGMIHPLLPGTEKVLKQINAGEWHGKEVTVHGKYYPAPLVPSWSIGLERRSRSIRARLSLHVDTFRNAPPPIRTRLGSVDRADVQDCSGRVDVRNGQNRSCPAECTYGGHR